MEQGNGTLRGNSVYKVPEGKLIKVCLEVSGVTGESSGSGNTLIDIKLTGDFFIHPEEWIADLETELKGASMDDVPDIVRGKAGEENVQLVGIGAEDILHAIELAFEITEQ